MQWGPKLKVWPSSYLASCVSSCRKAAATQLFRTDKVEQVKSSLFRGCKMGLPQLAQPAFSNSCRQAARPISQPAPSVLKSIWNKCWLAIWNFGRCWVHHWRFTTDFICHMQLDKTYRLDVRARSRNKFLDDFRLMCLDVDEVGLSVLKSC